MAGESKTNKNKQKTVFKHAVSDIVTSNYLRRRSFTCTFIPLLKYTGGLTFTVANVHQWLQKEIWHDHRILQDGRLSRPAGNKQRNTSCAGSDGSHWHIPDQVPMLKQIRFWFRTGHRSDSESDDIWGNRSAHNCWVTTENTFFFV